jgi:hypothetical protein
MGKQLAQPLGPRQLHREVPTLTPLWELRIERLLGGGNGVAEGLEEQAEELFAAAAGDCGELRLEGQGSDDQLGAFLALALQCAAKHLSDGDAQERRRDVGPVVYILAQETAVPRGPALGTGEAHGVHVEEECRRAPLGRGLGVEDVRHPEGQLERLHAGRVLVQQKPQIRCRLMGGAQFKQHLTPRPNRARPSVRRVQRARRLGPGPAVPRCIGISPRAGGYASAPVRR